MALANLARLMRASSEQPTSGFGPASGSIAAQRPTDLLLQHDFSQISVTDLRDSSQNRKSAAAQRAEFVFQTFIPDKYVPVPVPPVPLPGPDISRAGYGDNRGFGKPGDSFRTFQKVTIQTNATTNPSGIEEGPTAETGESKTTPDFLSGHASKDPLHMHAKRRDDTSVLIDFDGSIQNGAHIIGSLSPAIDFSGAVVISSRGGTLHYSFVVSHDAFPAYEAFINSKPVYRWSYPAGSDVLDLVGSGTAVQGKRVTGDNPGGVIGASPFRGFGGGVGGAGGAGGKY